MDRLEGLVLGHRHPPTLAVSPGETVALKLSQNVGTRIVALFQGLRCHFNLLALVFAPSLRHT
jgi:hypothetical protein